MGCKVLNGKKLSIELNLSNQSNMVSTISSNLSQFNFLVIIGNEYLNKVEERQAKIPLRICIDKSGELAIDGLDKEILNNEEKVKIYSSKKITSK